jgi:undecaprenyl pyrophosphate phosphatase UppP
MPGQQPLRGQHHPRGRDDLPQAIWIGLCQTLSAIFPGTSRSMSTIAAGQIAGLDRPAALEFSFLLSIPTMIAATGWDLLKERSSPATASPRTWS